MTDFTLYLRQLRRPALLVKAARIAAQAPSRARHGTTRLMAEEDALNAARLTGDAGYSPTRHVEVLSAMIALAAR